MSTISNISIDQGASFGTTVYLTDSEGLPLNLSGFSSSAEIRKSYQSSTSVVFTTEIALDEASGKISLGLSPAQTSNLEFGRYVWDLLVTNEDGVKIRAVEGLATVNPSVTRGE